MKKYDGEPILELIDVNKAFGGVVTANNVSFELYPGETLGLIGPNGAGKTTILNLISGIYDVDSGRILYNLNDITKVAPHDRAHLGIARTFQSPRFLQRSNMEDNMLLSLDLSSHTNALRSFFAKKDKKFRKDVEDLVEIAGLDLDWEEDISCIPYGNKKLLEIIRALLTNPKIMLVDEPAAGLNSKEIEKVVELLRYATQKKGIGVILIEHAMDMVMNVCDNIVVLNFGKLIASGTPEEVSSNKDVIEAYLGRDRKC